MKSIPKILLFFFFTISCIIVKSQDLKPLDPYKCNLGLYYSIDQEKENVLKHKIKSISTYCIEIKKNGSYKRKGKLIKTINFDQFGNPLSINSFFYKDYRWIYNFKNHVEKYEYLMEYDSLSRFVRTCEKLYKNNEIILNEIFYFYTKNGERENEEGTSKYIYKKKPIKNEVYSFGVNFKKDTISSNHEPIVVIKSWFYDNFTTDTVYSNTIKPQPTKKDSIIKLIIDSFGKITEKRLYFPTANCVNDVVLSEDLRTSQKLIKYDKDGNEELNEFFNSKGLLIETIRYNYNRNHLLIFIEEIYPKSRKEMKNKVWVYVYKYYN